MVRSAASSNAKISVTMKLISFGMSCVPDSINAPNMVVKRITMDLPSPPACSANAPRKSTSPRATALNNFGINSSKFTKPSTPLAPTAASVAKPAASAVNPTPAASVPSPRRATAPAKPNKDGSNGVIRAAATPNTVKAPARPNNAVRICPAVSLLRVTRGGTISVIAAATITMAAAPARAPFMRFAAATRITIAPPSPIKPFTI